MLTSMTGFGRGAVDKGDQAVQVIVRTYNARFLETKIRGIALIPEIEAAVREKINKSLIRGTVHVSIEKNQVSNKDNLSFNRQRFEAVENILYEIQKEYGRSLDMSSLISFEDLFLKGDNNELKEKTIMDALNIALDQVQTMRDKEGQAIHNDTLARLVSLTDQLNSIGTLSKELVTDQKEKLQKRVSKLMDNAAIDEQRFAQEVAMLADRTDISEELVRIRSHIDQFKALLELEEPTGKRLSFLLQELSREINTVGSKSGTGAIINIVVDFKNQLEKIREQVQNVL
ncbi:MAG: YicC family protein [Candidatus Marinimicrobia bacterium]|nr:YicC family protein [Candidatus Neomarinimicrobiota bacterium]|tara:strand:- start:1172 stop:2032 length:861 start_codon:yes stop_codon:yes gene_type:complete